MVGLLTIVNQLYNFIFKGAIWYPQNQFNSTTFVDVSVPSQESESHVCIGSFNFASVSQIFR